MRTLFFVFGIIMFLLGGVVLFGSKTPAGEMQGLVSWVIAAQLIGSAAIIEAINRLRPEQRDPAKTSA